MGLSELLARTAVRRAHVLVVPCPGWDLTRMAADAALRRRGWTVAVSPADADVLLVAGAPGPALAGVVERLWEQLPGPRARVVAHGPGDVATALEEAERVLLDLTHQRRDAAERATEPELDMDDGDHGDMDHGDMDHGDMDHGDMDHGDMDHGDMEMSPGGIPLASGADDRDGLEMDVLHVRLGPVLPHWPAGLVLTCTLQGDVVVEASADLVEDREGRDHEAGGHHHAGLREETPHPSESAPVGDAARCSDRAGALLSLAGWEAAADRARTVRDALLDEDHAAARAAVDRLGRQVRRSWLLRRSLHGLAPLTGSDLDRLGLPAGLAGDTYDRLLLLLDRVEASTRAPDARAAADVAPGAAAGDTAAGVRRSALGALADVVTGLDLATARLVVAGLGVEPSSADREVSHA